MNIRPKCCWILEIIALVWAPLVWANTPGANVKPLTTLAVFDTRNGAGPLSLIQGSDGAFYGITSQGGVHNGGSVFKVTNSGMLTTLYSFCAQSNCTDGAFPTGSIEGTDGFFYGTTLEGGNVSGSGNVFKITKAGGLTTLYNFCAQQNCADGENPNPLVQGADGAFYGTTQIGGTKGAGTAFKITSGGVFTTLHTFTGSDGAAPAFAMIQANDGNFYGITAGGSSTGSITVFKLTPQGTVTTLHTFCNKPICPDPGNLIQAADGNLYGTRILYKKGAVSGDPIIFKLTLEGVLTTYYSFCSPSEVCNYSVLGLIQGSDGAFYGITDNDSGTIFNLSQSREFKVIDTFDGANGYGPTALIQGTNGRLYGTTLGSASDGIGGTVFRQAVGLEPFVVLQGTLGAVGAVVNILGNNLEGTTSVSFDGVSATFTVISGSEIQATIPDGATTGPVVVTTPGGLLTSSVVFTVI